MLFKKFYLALNYIILLKIITYSCVFILSFSLLNSHNAWAGEPTKNFSNTCKNIYLDRDGSTLKAQCELKDDKGSQSTSLNLNTYIKNTHGNLRWDRKGNFIASCFGMGLTNGNTVLAGTCFQDGNRQGSHFTGIDLNDHIGNNNGSLVCDVD